MIADVNIKDYYLQFIYEAKADVNNYNKSLKEINDIKENIYKYINGKKDYLGDKYGIYLDVYNEWKDKEYTSSETLYQKSLKTYKNINTVDENEDTIIILQLLKYCTILRNEHKTKRLIVLAIKRKQLKFNEYRQYITTYYNKVHKCVLEGFGYKFNNGIGTYCINYWKMDREKMKKKRFLDYAATNAKKKELLEKGVKLYDEKLAQWYKLRHIPYDGVDYRVWKEDNYFYDITFIKSDIFSCNNLEYKHTEYVANKYRGMSYMEMADKLCKDLDDISKLQVDIKYKLNIYLYKYPQNYINFIRNEEQCKYKLGAHNS